VSHKLYDCCLHIVLVSLSKQTGPARRRELFLSLDSHRFRENFAKETTTIQKGRDLVQQLFIEMKKMVDKGRFYAKAKERQKKRKSIDKALKRHLTESSGLNP